MQYNKKNNNATRRPNVNTLNVNTLNNKMYTSAQWQRKVIFKNGIPVGANRDTTPRTWLCKQKPNNYGDMRKLYNYKILKENFSWTKNWRCGILFISCSDDKIRHVLMVYHKECIFRGEKIDRRLGFPKGEATIQDVSALDTAIREFKEETSINLFDQNIDAKLAINTIVTVRPETGVEEVQIYFIVLTKEKPNVVYCEHELDGYEWVNLGGGLQCIEPVTTPTRLLLKYMETLNFWDPIETVDLCKK